MTVDGIFAEHKRAIVVRQKSIDNMVGIDSNIINRKKRPESCPRKSPWEFPVHPTTGRTANP
jgi:hypothetical protein